MVAAAQMPAAYPPEPPARAEGEERFLLRDVSWDMYVALREALDTPGLRMTYHEGALELMSPSPAHEVVKKTIARLIEVFALERDVPLYGYGSTTFRRKAKQRGLEPDECYCLGGPLKEVPDIALEVVLSSGGLEKLPVYEGLLVREVWFWERETFHLHALRSSGYEAVESSELIPALDFQVLASHARKRDQHEAVKAFRDWLRAGS